MKYFRLLEDMSICDRMHVDLIVADNGDWMHFLEAKPLPPRGAAEVFVAGPILQFFTSNFAAPIAQRPLAAAIQRLAGADVQLVELELNISHSLVALNVLRLQNCVNESRSVFTRFDETDTHRPDLMGRFKDFTKLVVDETRIDADAHIFRIADWRVGLIVSDSMRLAMLEAGCRGAEFQLVSGESVE